MCRLKWAHVVAHDHELGPDEYLTSVAPVTNPANSPRMHIARPQVVGAQCVRGGTISTASLAWMRWFVPHVSCLVSPQAPENESVWYLRKFDKNHMALKSSRP